MRNSKFQIDSIKYVDDEVYRKLFIKKFNECLNTCIEIKKAIQLIIDNDFDINFIARPNHFDFLRYSIDCSNDDIKNIFTYFFNVNKKNKDFKIVIKLIYTKAKYKWNLKNKNEVRKQFYEVLISNEHDLAFYEYYLDRTETFKNILLDEREKLKGIPDSSIYDIQELFYNNACKIVKHYPVHYPMLFQFENYIKKIEMKKNDVLPFEKKKIKSLFYQHITDISNVDRKTISPRYRDFSKKKLIPDFSKKFFPMK